MRAVNLIPGGAQGGANGRPGVPEVPVYAILGLLAAALVLVTVYVLTSNTIADRESKVGNLQAQAAQANTQAASLNKYTQFEQLAQTRAETVRQIASTRFDWHHALSDLSKIVPANTSLSSLTGTVAPGAGSGAASGGSAGSGAGLRTAVASPAFELSGCTSSQDDVARLISRLRLINGVTRVALADSGKPTSSPGSAAVAQAAAGGGASTTANCGSDAPLFDLVVFFQPLAGAGPTGVTALAAQPVGSGAAGSTAAVPAPSGAGTATTPSSSTPAPSTGATTTTPGVAR